MIDFLAPLYLAAAAVAAIPLFLHLIRRRIGTRREFPAVRYLARAEREHSRKLRLRNLLLMLLRVLAVLLVALAAARPVARVIGSGHAPTALAVVLDNSLSTSAVVNGQTVLEGLEARARLLVERASPGDQIWLVTADGVVRGGSRGTVLTAIRRTESLAGAGDPEHAVTVAASLVRAASTVAHEVAIFTDAQATSWTDPLSLGRVHVVAYRPRTDPPVNHAVTESAASPGRWTPDGAVRARILTPDSAVYRIALEGRTVARGTAARNEEVVVHATPAARGWMDGSVELEPDELRGDDVRRFAVWVGAAPAVAASPALGIFARSALDALVSAGRAAVGNDIAMVPANDVTTLPALIVAPADPLRVGAANRALERLGIPWRFGEVQNVASTVNGVPGDSSRLAGVTVMRRYALERRAGTDAPSDTLAMAGADPWIVAGPTYVIVASPLIPQATNFPVRAAFVPWLGDVFSQRLEQEVGSVINAAPGVQVGRPANADGLELAGGERLSLSGDSLTAPDQPGVYFFMHGTRRLGALVVNPEARESALARLNNDALAARLRGSDVRVVDDAATLHTHTLSSAPRRPIVAPLLMLALLVLVVESAVVGTGRRRAA
ncbi:MAG TPA: VWA domain-containing protein [Gemmatimonadaceae bacterium]|nr:VWA domain-containing protein [Gemmatimonadaceae bacterium]